MSELLAFDEIMDDVVEVAPKKKKKKKPVKEPTTKKTVEMEEPKEVAKEEAPKKEEPKEIAKEVAPKKETPKKKAEAEEEATGWHSSVIGDPKGYLNPLFRGIIGYDAQLGGRQVEIPFDEIKAASRYIYVDDIYAENPKILKTLYYVIGDFRTVIAFLPEESFNELIALKKGHSVYYSYVSPHEGELRNYQFHHEKWPTAKDLKELDEVFDSRQRR